jgi:hypothetical protein
MSVMCSCEFTMAITQISLIIQAKPCECTFFRKDFSQGPMCNTFRMSTISVSSLKPPSRRMLPFELAHKFLMSAYYRDDAGPGRWEAIETNAGRTSLFLRASAIITDVGASRGDLLQCKVLTLEVGIDIFERAEIGRRIVGQ